MAASVEDTLKFLRTLRHAFRLRLPKVSATSAELVDPDAAFNRNEVITKLITTLIGLAASFAVTYFGVKYLAGVIDPTRQEKKESQKRAEKLMKQIGVNDVKLTDYELCIASNLVDPQIMAVEWANIGGLKETIDELRETVIIPFQRRDLFEQSRLLQAPKGVLLYGPPGCGKTMIAKATAKAAGARFINLQVSSLVDKWYGESQKRAEAIFSLAIKIQPTIIFIDEIDSFLRSRTSSDHEATAMIKTQFMSWWDGLMTEDKYQIMIVGATNRPQDVDAAILRRMPCTFNIGLPNIEQRREILALILKEERMEVSVDLDEQARRTEGLSGSDLREFCRSAAVCRVREYIQSSSGSDDKEGNLHHADLHPVGVLRRMTSADFDVAYRKVTKRFGIPIGMQLDVD